MSTLKQYKTRAANESARKRATKMQLSEFAYAGAIGIGEGLAEQAGVAFVTDGLGPVKFEYIQILAGYYLATKRSGKTRELGSAMATIGIYKTTKSLGSGFSLGGLFGS
jgi:hypothetical protein